jgi:hypothetical protein
LLSTNASLSPHKKKSGRARSAVRYYVPCIVPGNVP